AIGTVLHRAAPAVEHEACSRLAAAESGAVDETAALRVFPDERAHLVDELHRRRVARFGMRIVLVHDHEAHGDLLRTVSGWCRGGMRGCGRSASHSRPRE